MNTEKKETAKTHTSEMAKKYGNEILRAIRSSRFYNTNFLENHKEYSGETPEVCFENKDSVSSVLAHAGSGRTAVLNFASFKNPGGGFINGAYAQEEALCHESFLFNVLREFREYYSWNQKHLNRGLYMSRAIYTPDVVFERGDQTAKCDVITCAAPNRTLSIRYKRFSGEENSEAIRERIRLIKTIAEENEVDTIILGAFGCGVFRQKPEEIADVFEEVFRETSIKKVVFAVPGNDVNAEVFRRKFG